MRFVDEHRDRYAVALLLRVLEVGPSTFYGWAKRAERPCARDLVDLGLVSNIHEIWTSSGETYGADRVRQQLRREGIRVARKRVERLMHEQGWQGAFLRKGWRNGSTRQDPKATPAPDLVERAFARLEPDQLWVTDITEHSTREGKLYCSVVLDVFSRRVVGWSIDSAPTAALVTNALGMAIQNRDPDGTLIHSDHGTQFTSWAFTRRALDSGLVPSMGSIGDCFDNAVIESFWARMQVELLDRQRWSTRVELANAIFEYLEMFHNRKRRHSALGCSLP